MQGINLGDLAPVFACLRRGDYVAAVQILRWTSDQQIKTGNSLRGLQSLLIMGECCDLLGERVEADAVYKEVEVLAETTSDAGQKTEALLGLASQLTRRGHFQRAWVTLRQALSYAEKDAHLNSVANLIHGEI